MTGADQQLGELAGARADVDHVERWRSGQPADGLGGVRGAGRVVVGSDPAEGPGMLLPTFPVALRPHGDLAHAPDRTQMSDGMGRNRLASPESARTVT
jgi:hypothetical protein